MLVENRLVSYDKQPYLDTNTQAARELLLEVLQVEGAYAQFMLEVWQRLVIDLDDPCLGNPPSARPTLRPACKRCGA